MKHVILTFMLLLSVAAHSQNVTIDYQAWNPNNPPCNIFANATNVPATGVPSGTIEHQTKVGQPFYNNSDQAIQLPTNYISASSYQGTRFRLAYNFKAGYSYLIYVTVAADINTVGYPTGPYLRVDVNNNGGGGSTACNGPDGVNPNLSGNPAAVQVPSDAFQEIPFSPFVQGSSQPTLEVTSIPAQNGSTKTIRLRKIRIVEIAPTPTFTISPSTIPITCGITSSQTSFAVTNVNSTPNVTNYTWNLGSSSNGWLYNGNAAPQTISTGTTSTLSLTPVCGATPSNVSATVTAGGNSYQTNTAMVSVSNPALTINGASNICTNSENYTIDSLPCNASVVWSINPSGIVSLTTSGNTATLSKITDGDITLTATVSNVCGGSNIVLQKTVHTGLPIVLTNSGNTSFSSTSPGFPPYDNDVCSSALDTIAMEITGATSVVWSGPSRIAVNWHTDGNNLIFYFFAPNQSALFHVTASNGCGTVTKYFGFNSIDCSGGGDPCGGGLTTFNVSVSPNPSTNKIIVVPNVPPPCNE
ncbi:MAG: hypothetical protein JSR12_01135, partial [Bacteroidetes bacterium]|nr:hypothetical protein [Bacteroidota bacterium]MBS1642770.1 hypothetical protein [Bacteroidota bacterium]